MGDPLRVAMPMLNYVPGGMGGSETYAAEIARELDARPDVEVVRIVSGAAAGVMRGGEEIAVPRVRGGHSTAARVASLLAGAVADRRSRAAVRSADVVHYPFTVPVPVLPGLGRSVVSLLDVQHLDLPHFFPRAEREYRRVTYDWAARRAGSVVTISEFCKQRIVEHLGVRPERITVAPLAVDADFFGALTALRERFVFYPARHWPHKNHERLFQAMELVRRRHPDLRLVLSGQDGLTDAPPWVENRGRVSREQLRELYATAACLVFPSLYEGFGLPPLEAMAAGCPVASSNAGSLPEVCGDAAVMFDPYDVPSMAAAIESALEMGERQVAAAAEWAGTFTWAACAERHLEAYHSTQSLGSGHPPDSGSVNGRVPPA